MFLTEKEKLVKSCPKCKEKFIKNKGADCALSCEEKKLENKHEGAIVSKIIPFCLSKLKTKIIVKFPKRLSAKWVFSKVKGWGWTDDIKGIVNIPWYTLRSKREFFDTVSHEIGHIIAYRKKFSLSERKALKIYTFLWESYKTSKNASFLEKLKKHDLKHKKIMDEYRKWGDGHDYIWYQEYLKLHKKLVNSPFVESAYGNTEPRSHGFDKHGKGQHKPNLKKE